MSGHPLLVFCDMDGTYLHSDKSVSQANLAIVESLDRHGCGFVPCTGRMLSGIPRELSQHPKVHYVVCSMGATIVELGATYTDGRSHRNIFEGGVEKSDVMELYRRLSPYNIQFDVFANGHSYAERRRLDQIDRFPINPGMMGFVRRQRIPIDIDIPTYIKQVDRIERLNIYYLNESDGDKIRAILDDMPMFSHTSHDGCGIEVVNTNLSKGTALLWLCEYLNIPPERSMAFGDGENDIPMLEAAGIGIAVENADNVCKQHADFVTEHNNDNDGVARFLEEQAWQR